MSISEVNFRRIATSVLDRFDPAKKNIAELIDQYTGKSERRRQVIDVVLGVVRNRLLIDRIIETISDRNIDKISRPILNIIRIGIYEIVFSSSQADYAIVNEAVNLASCTAKKASGFVNALLRNTARAIENKSVDFVESDKAKTVPISTASGCQFKLDILPEPETAPAEYLSCAFSLPLWLIRRWLDEFGFERTIGICFGCNRRPSIYARANTLKISAEKLCDELLTEGVDCSLTSEPNVIRLGSPGNISALAGFKRGLFMIQDITAGKAVKLLAPAPGESVLDICAAPGTKTIQIAQLIGDNGRVIATDINSQRLKKVSQSVSRLSITSVQTVNYDKLPAIASELGLFDSILIDAPCSNTGVMAKRPEVRYRINEKDLKSICKIQTELLSSVVALLKPQGKICYSTCSIIADENGDIIKAFLNQHSDFHLLSERIILPNASQEDCDGGYAAVVCR
ncbi:MAG: class I SAM-dependent methyltransferase [Anaerohalosphaeraceae bacterium]|nr:class I SAM-dependent methyltransferase [Anaerohalosphaeraceae bacterium]